MVRVCSSIGTTRTHPGRACVPGIEGRPGDGLESGRWLAGAPGGACAVEQRHRSGLSTAQATEGCGLRPAPFPYAAPATSAFAPGVPPDLRAPEVPGQAAEGRGFEGPSYSAEHRATFPYEAPATSSFAPGGVPELRALDGSPQAAECLDLRQRRPPDDGFYAETQTQAPLSSASASSAASGSAPQDSSSRPVVIALDVDEVLCCYYTCFWKYLEMRGIGPLNDDYVFREAHDPYSPLRLEFAEEGGLENLEAVPGAAAALECLKAAGARLEVVTCRPSLMRESTEILLGRLYPPGIFADMHFVGAGEKGLKCQAIGASALVDDQIPNIVDATTAGVLGLLLDVDGLYPWSQCEEGYLPDGALRFTSWNAVCAALFASLPLVLPTSSSEGPPLQQHDPQPTWLSAEFGVASKDGDSSKPMFGISRVSGPDRRKPDNENCCVS